MTLNLGQSAVFSHCGGPAMMLVSRFTLVSSVHSCQLTQDLITLVSTSMMDLTRLPQNKKKQSNELTIPNSPGTIRPSPGPCSVHGASWSDHTPGDHLLGLIIQNAMSQGISNVVGHTNPSASSFPCAWPAAFMVKMKHWLTKLKLKES